MYADLVCCFAIVRCVVNVIHNYLFYTLIGGGFGHSMAFCVCVLRFFLMGTHGFYIKRTEAEVWPMLGMTLLANDVIAAAGWAASNSQKTWH